MKKRMRSDSGGGGRGLWRQKQKELISDLGNLAKSDNPPDLSNEDDVVSRLLTEHVAYKRQRIGVVRKLVKETLPGFNCRRRSRIQPQPLMSADEEEEETYSKRRKCNSSEEALQRIEEAHLRRKRRSAHRPSSSSSSDDENNEATSTSEDAIYGEELEPAPFDLTKLMLRSSYKEQNKKREEIEARRVMTNKKAKVSSTAGSGAESEAKSSVSRDAALEVKEGPKFSDLGGMEKLLEELTHQIIMPLQGPWLPQLLGLEPMSGILLSGPPGCGKTTLARAIANEAALPFYQIYGASDASAGENIREVFSKAYKTAPSIVFIDEIDAFGSKRDNMQREMDKQRVTQLITCMTEFHGSVQPADTNSGSQRSAASVLVIGATNRPDALDPALRRRFGSEIVLGVPDENARLAILSVITRKLRLEGSFNLLKLARSTPGYVGSDLQELSNRAGMIAMTRFFREIRDRNEDFRKPPQDTEKFAITMSDFEEALLVVQPSSKREGFSAVPNVKWEDVGGLDLLRKQFERYIVRRIKEPESSEKFNVKSETGILLYGPPGCGKTLIAKAVANEAGANFIYVKGPELLDKYVGESERAVRTLFTRARKCSPCIIFFDEVDALTTRRGTEAGWSAQGLLNQLLVELDGADQRQGVFVIGATNRPDVLEPALLRPGRFSKHIYVSPPSTEERGLILKAIARKYPVDASVDLDDIGKWEACVNFSGADLAELVNEAAICARDETETSTESSSDTFTGTIRKTHFELAVAEITPSLTKTQLRIYQKFGEDHRV